MTATYAAWPMGTIALKPREKTGDGDGAITGFVNGPTLSWLYARLVTRLLRAGPSRRGRGSNPCDPVITERCPGVLVHPQVFVTKTLGLHSAPNQAAQEAREGRHG